MMRRDLLVPGALSTRLHRRVQRLMTRLQLRLSQSRDGLRRAARRMDDPGLGLWLLDQAHGRDHDAVRLRLELQEAALDAPPRIDIAGRLHRALIASLGEAGDAALLDECTRGDHRLLRSAARALDGPLPDAIRIQVERLYAEVRVFLRDVEATRRALDAGVVTYPSDLAAPASPAGRERRRTRERRRSREHRRKGHS